MPTISEIEVAGLCHARMRLKEAHDLAQQAAVSLAGNNQSHILHEAEAASGHLCNAMLKIDAILFNERTGGA